MGLELNGVKQLTGSVLLHGSEKLSLEAGSDFRINLPPPPNPIKSQGHEPIVMKHSGKATLYVFFDTPVQTLQASKPTQDRSANCWGLGLGPLKPT